jgi:hypothetical protein
MPPQTAALAADDAYATTGRLAWAMLRLVRLTFARDRCRLKSIIPIFIGAHLGVAFVTPTARAPDWRLRVISRTGQKRMARK